MIFLGIVGVLVISFALWVKKEKRQDVFFIIGGLLLLAYSIFIKDTVFIALQIVFILSSAAELVRLRTR